VSRVLAFALIAWLALCGSTFAQDLEVNVRGSGGRAYQVAVQRFSHPGEIGLAADRVHGELSPALASSASFDLVPLRAFLEPEQTTDFAEPMVPCDNWRASGADVLVQGRIELQGTGVRIHYRVWDLGRCRLQGDTAYLDAKPEDLWLAARKVADEVVYRFTGRRGVSSTQVAFVSDTSGNKEIYLMEADGSRRRRVTSNGRINLFPSWSPDGHTLVYTSYRAGSSDLWTLTRGRSGRRLLEIPAEKYRGVFGPQDGQITFVMSRAGNTDLYITRTDGRGLRRVTNDRAIEVSPAWSPDGRRLVFASDRSGSQQIYMKDMDSGKERRLTYRGSYNASPAWSPTGEWVVYTARTGSSFDLYLIDPETGYTTQLTDHPRSEEDPAWSPDGRKILFVSNRLGPKDVYVIDVDGRNSRRITDGFGNCSNPAWSRWQD
jgi:TolB protein